MRAQSHGLRHAHGRADTKAPRRVGAGRDYPAAFGPAAYCEGQASKLSMTLLLYRTVKRVKIEVDNFADHSHRQTEQCQTGTAYRMTAANSWLV